jgi:hypothetical protein
VLALLIAIFGVLAALNTPTEIFPSLNIPVVSVLWTDNGHAKSFYGRLKQHTSIGVSPAWRNYTCTRIDIIYSGRSSLA